MPTVEITQVTRGYKLAGGEPVLHLRVERNVLRLLRGVFRLPRDQQKKVHSLVAQFMKSPTRIGLNYETIHSSTDDRMRSLRIDTTRRQGAHE